MNKLHRYWITFKDAPKFSTLGLGCGVTAYEYSDAMAILATEVFVGKPMLEIESVIEDVNVQNLDQGHVVPNMGVAKVRGVWFPQLR